MLKITDSQIHDFYPNTPARPWPEGAVSPHGPECTIETIRSTIDKAGVHRVILVPPSWTGWDNEYSLAAARKDPDRFGVFGRFNPQAPDAKEVLKNWRKQQGMLKLFLGVRYQFLRNIHVLRTLEHLRINHIGNHCLIFPCKIFVK